MKRLAKYLVLPVILILSGCLYKFLYSEHNPQGVTVQCSPESTLMQALDEMNTQAIACLLDGVDINKTEIDALSPLTYVLMYKYKHPRAYEVIKLLLDAKADVTSNQRGWTNLHQAIRIKNVEITRLLLEHGARVDATDANGRTPLHHACLVGFSQGVKLLLSYSANVLMRDNRSFFPIHLAAGKGRMCWSQQKDYAEIVCMLGADPNNLNVQDRKGRTPLHFAAVRGSDLVVAALINNGADAGIIDCHRALPMHYAAGKMKVKYADKEQYCTIVKRLALAGSYFDRIDKDGMTPLHYAAAHGNSLIVDFLVDHGAHVNAIDREGATPLHYALGRDSLRFMPLKYHEHVISIGQIKAHHSIYEREEADHGAITTKLLQAGALPHVKDFGGYTPLWYAIRHNHHNLQKIVEKNNSSKSFAWRDLGLSF